MLKNNKKRKIATLILLSFILQVVQNFYIAKVVYAEEVKEVKISKEEVIKDKESNTLSFKIRVQNNKEENLDLSKLILSYWYDDQGIKNEEVIKDWISIDKSKVDVEIEKMNQSYERANSRIKISFKDGLNELKKNDEIELNIRLQNKQWESYNQEKNYSFMNDITAEYNGENIFGTTPNEISAEEPIIKVDSKMYNKQLNKDITAIYPWFKIINSGNVNLDLSKLELRYYYTIDSDSSEEVVIDWANIGKEKIIPEIQNIEDRREADRYLSIKLNSNDKLGVGKELEVHSRLNKKNWEAYDQYNDYSFNKDAIDYTDWSKILVLYDGNIISGEEPEINDGLQDINLKAERRRNVVSLKWNEIEDAYYLIESSVDGRNFTEVKNNLIANMYVDATAEKLDSIYYYRVIAFDKDGNRVGKSKNIKLDLFKDSDDDSLNDEEEIELGTDPNNSDTDGDGLTDGEEVLVNKTNPLIKDTDSDGLDDAYEVYISDTNPLKTDTDGNGVLDGDEDLDKDGLTISEESKLNTNPKENDSDFDGLSDKDEIYKYKTDPNNRDTDEDGILDGLEIELKFNPNNTDSNGDGVLDGEEIAKYSYETEEYQKDNSVNAEVEGNFLAKEIENISITNMEGMHVMTSKETPGYIGSPYSIKVPKGSTDVSIKFNYDKSGIKEGADPTLYKLDKEKNTLVEVKGQDKSKDGIVSLELKNNIEQFTKNSKNSEEIDYYINDNFILIDKKEWDKYWESEIKHPSEKGKLDLAFVIDTSGSMSSNDRNKYRVQLAKHFINKKVEEDRMALIGFSSSSNIYQNLTDNKSLLLSNVDKLGLASGGTHISSGVDSAIKQLKDSSNRDKKIILLTDGEGTFYDSSLEAAKKENIKIYTIGLGTSYDKKLLEKIANETGGKYYHVKTGEEIGDIEDDIHGDAGNQDMDGDGIPDKEDDKPYENNIVLGKFDKNDKVFKQASNLAYSETDKYKNKKVSSAVGANSKKFNRLLDWTIIESDDSYLIGPEEKADCGFGAVAIKKGNRVIISFEGTDFGGDMIGDVLGADIIGIAMGLPSTQLYKAYEFTAKIMEKYKNNEIYITGHSLGGWLATKVTGTIINTDNNITKQIPLGLKKYAKEFGKTMKMNSSKLKKSIPLAAPGFVAGSRILVGEKGQVFKNKLFSYKIDSDPISLFGFDAFLVGNVKFINAKKALDEKCKGNARGHALEVYYHHFDNYFNPNLSYDFR